MWMQKSEEHRLNPSSPFAIIIQNLNSTISSIYYPTISLNSTLNSHLYFLSFPFFYFPRIFGILFSFFFGNFHVLGRFFYRCLVLSSDFAVSLFLWSKGLFDGIGLINLGFVGCVDE